MREQQFTDQPWEYDESQRYYSTRVIRHNGVLICHPARQTTMTEAEYSANVRLLTAAPKLLALLKSIREHGGAAAAELDPLIDAVLAEVDGSGTATQAEVARLRESLLRRSENPQHDPDHLNPAKGGNQTDYW